MEIVILILCIFMLFISGASCAVTVLLWNKIKNTKDSSTPEIKNLREDILNELSRNRNEQNHLNHTQRTELSESLDKVSKNIEQLSQTNSNQLTAMYRDMFSKLNEIRDRSSEDTQKQNEKIQASLEKIRESNEKKLDEMRTVVDEKLTATLTERLDSSFKTVSEQLTNLYKALGEMKEMSGGITEHVSTLTEFLQT